MHSPFGSIWRKWDLHFHTPSSFDYDNGSVSNQDIIDRLIEEEVEVLAVTDHHTIDVERIKELRRLADGKITILPGIELRCELGGSESIHFIGIFSEKSDLDELWDEIRVNLGLSQSKIEEKGGHERIYCDFEDSAKLFHELGGLVSVHAGGKSNSLESIKNNHQFKQKIKTDLVAEHIDIFELGKKEDQEDYNEIVFPAIGIRKPMILCSDNHDVKNYSVKENLWIKADPTFEGLKQILFEPEHRVHIGDVKPYLPPIRIDKVETKFPENTQFESDVFCFSGDNEINFSPNFTCIIGGRGTGKSTLLNLIHESLKPNGNEFFQGRELLSGVDPISDISAHVQVDENTDEKYIEFLSQNKVEDFARSYSKLTGAIYTRILKRDQNGEISQSESDLESQIKEFQEYIKNQVLLTKKEGELKQTRKELEANKKIVDSLSSDEYSNLKETIDDLSFKVNKSRETRSRYNELVNKLSGIEEEYALDSMFFFRSEYQEEQFEIVESVRNILEETKAEDFSEFDARIEAFESELATKKEELREFLISAGLTEENQQDITNATIATDRIKTEIDELEEEIERLKLKDFSINSLKRAAVRYRDTLNLQIQGVSELLEKIDNPNVQPISLELDFDCESAKEKAFKSFKEIFEKQIAESQHQGDKILKDLLFCVNINEIGSLEDYIAELESYNTKSVAKDFLLGLFSKPENYLVFTMLCKLYSLSLNKFKIIRVKYDGKPLNKSSFGQRCTAVLVILLLLGNNPIIIDEPEAHLDSLLISDYLVNVIKEQKRSRQIIFATHNANFVINGDADLIHILKLNKDSKTDISSTTIETDRTRGVLVDLEGGEEAFRKREGIYSS